MQKIKRSIRSTERFLAKLGERVSASERLEHERRLQALQSQLILEQKSQIEQKHMQKYKMVRFFERKKAERHFRKAVKSSTSDQNRLSSQDALCELLYVRCHPRIGKYHSIFANDKRSPEALKMLSKIRVYLTDNNIDQYSKQLEASISRLLLPQEYQQLKAPESNNTNTDSCAKTDDIPQTEEDDFFM